MNKFLICSIKLENKREGYTTATKRHKFLDQIKDDEYDIVKQQLQGDMSIDFNTFVKRIRSRKQDLSTSKKTEEKGRARRFVRKGGNVNSNKSNGTKRKYYVPEGKIPSIPGYILYKIKPEYVRKDLIRWRGIYNDKKRMIRVNELQRNSRHKSGNESYAETEASQESPRPIRKVKEDNNRRVKTARKTTVKNSG